MGFYCKKLLSLPSNLWLPVDFLLFLQIIIFQKSLLISCLIRVVLGCLEESLCWQRFKTSNFLTVVKSEYFKTLLPFCFSWDWTILCMWSWVSLVGHTTRSNLDIPIQIIEKYSILGDPRCFSIKPAMPYWALDRANKLKLYPLISSLSNIHFPNLAPIHP